MKLTSKIRIILTALLLNSAMISAQTEFKITASDGAQSDQFGAAVDISGNFAIVGSLNDDDLGTNSGAAYIFSFDGISWVQTQKLTPSDGTAEDGFGWDVAIDGNFAVVGARYGDGLVMYSGSAYILTFDGTNWIQTQKLTPSDGQAFDEFGVSVAISGNQVVIGAPANDSVATASGAAYFYEFNGSNWVQQQKVIASDAASSDYFGWDVSISGNTALISAPYDDDNGSNSGSTYVFEFNGVGWVQFQKLLAADGDAFDYFGWSVALDVNQAVISAQGDAVQSGSAYIFNFNATNWSQTQKINASDGNPLDRFGLNVDIDGDLVVIGAPWDDDKGASSGSAYLFGKSSSWIQLSKILPADGTADAYFGSGVAISDSTIIVGALGDDDNGLNSGAAYLYSLGPPPNDLCSGALSIGCGQTVNSSTAFNDDFDPPSNCTTPLNTAPGIWYSFPGTGENMLVSLCGASFDTKLGIFSGTCGALTCIAGNDDFCGLQSQVTFPTTLGGTYYAYITGYQTESGSVSLTLNCAAPINDICVNALPVSCGSNIIESTFNATGIGLSTPCGTTLNTAPGVWYKYTGTGDQVTMSLCNSSFDTKIGVIQGVCNSFVCVAGNDNACGQNGLASQVTFTASAGVEYLVYVTGAEGQTGEFELNVVCGIVNDLCANATPIACGTTTSGNTSAANNTGNPGTCNTYNLSTGPGVWFKHTGTGSSTVASLCGSDFDTQIGIFTGTCGALTCVGANDDACSLQSQITFATVAGTTYYIYVTGYQALSGNYQLALSCAGSTCGSAPVASTSNITSNSVQLNWTAVTGAMSYRIQGSSAGGSVVTLNVPSSPTLFNVNNLPSNTTYNWAVKAVCNASGTLLSPQSNTSNFTTLPGCTTPAGLWTTNLTASSVTLNWFVVPGATAYKISGNKLGITPDINITVSGGSTPSFNVINLAANTSYSWTVRSICPAGSSLVAARDTFSTLTAAKKESGVTEMSKLDAEQAIQIFPNPAQDHIGIRLNTFDPVDLVTVIIYDQKGQEVFTANIQANSGSLYVPLPEQLHNGVYRVQVGWDDQMYMKKLVLLK